MPHPTRRRDRPHRALPGARLAAVAAVLLAVLAGCAGGRDDGAAGSGTPATGAGHDAGWADVDAALADRIEVDGLDGAGVLVARGDDVRHRALLGGHDDATVLPIASASKWLTSATLETLVDEGRLDLDVPVGRYLPAWDAPTLDGVTIRRLLAHQAGLDGSYGCIGSSAMTLRECADSIAGAPLAYEPGTEFHYGNAGYTVAAAAAEAVTDTPFEQLFRQRIGDPLGLERTGFGGTRDEPATNPVPAASGRSTLDEYGRFVHLMADRGELDGRRLLSERAVAEIEADQVRGLDTRGDDAVQTTGIPTYGLGVWRDRTGPADETLLLSGSGSVGFYPWIDRTRGAWGVIALADRRHGADHNVPASARLLYDVVLPALDADIRATTPPATPPGTSPPGIAVPGSAAAETTAPGSR